MNRRTQRKKERRYQRYLKNVQKEKEHKQKAWEEGKLLKPQMGANNVPWPPDICDEFGKRLVSRIKEYKERVASGEFDDFEIKSAPGVKYTRQELFIFKFRLYKIKTIEFILHYNPDIPKSWEYNYLKEALEIYWDSPEELYDRL